MTKALPAAIDPAHVARRLSIQRSRFVGDREGLIRLADVPGSRLIKIVLPGRHLLRMRLDLATCGIVDTTVFPDLEGLSRELIRFWKTPWPL